MTLTPDEMAEAQELLRLEAAWQDCKFTQVFPDCQPSCQPASTERRDHAGLCRVLYRKHLEFFRAGASHRERLFLAANQIGKTMAAAYEVTCHLTGRYPHWWAGRQFDRATKWWAAGDTMLTTRDILQVTLMGPLDAVSTGAWSGIIPRHLIKDATRRAGGVSECLDQVRVRHGSGDLSVIEFRSYDQGRRSFQGTAQDGIWLDEEPPDADHVYPECLMRTITTDGLVITTFTPLRGLTPFLVDYLNSAQMADSAGNPRPAIGLFGIEAGASE